MQNKLISIIMPAYNASRHIVETFESIKLQTYGNWELIVVNDCSTDNTVEIVNQFSKEVSNNIKLIINESNQGVSASRNIAVDRAAGTWLALLDSDDIWLPNHLETLMEEVDKDSALNFVYSGCLVFLDDVNNIIFEQKITEEMLHNFNISLFTHQIGINPCTVLLDKKSWNSVGGMVKNQNHAEDKDLFIQLARAGAKFKFTGQMTALYRKYSSTATPSNNAIKMSYGGVYVFEKHFDWEAIPLKIRINLLSDAYLSYARLNRKNNISRAVEYSLKALKTQKSIKNIFYFSIFKVLCLIQL